MPKSSIPVKLEMEERCRIGCLGLVLNGENSRCCGDTVKQIKITNNYVTVLTTDKHE